MTENREPVVKFILNKGEIGNIHTALKILVDESLTGSPQTDVQLMDIMTKLAPVYDEMNYGDTTALELDPQAAFTCWKALSYVMENALAPESQQTKLITLVQHLGYALECLNNIQIDPKEVAQMENVIPLRK